MAMVFCLPALAQDIRPAFDQVFERHSAVMLVIDPATGRLVDANPAASDFYGYTHSELTELSIQDINTLTAEEVAAERQLAISENRSFFIFQHRLATGEIRTVKVASSPFELHDKKLLFSVISDITDQRQAQNELWHYQTRLEQMVERQSEDLHRSDQRIIMLLVGGASVLLLVLAILVVDLIRRRQAESRLKVEQQRMDEIIRGTNVGTWEWNIGTDELVLNERWANIIGYSLSELIPVTTETCATLVHPDDYERGRRVLEKVFRKEQEHYEVEQRMRHKSGEWVWVHVRGSVVEWSSRGEPRRMSGTQVDITRRKQDHAQIEYLAKYDLLTGLPNRTLFFDRCSMALASARRNRTQVALMFIDLDAFKPINDRLGHDAGDQILQQVANRLVESVREMDTVARFGGDEFTVLLTGLIDHTPVDRVAKKIIRNVSSSYELACGEAVELGCSIGIALFPEDGTTTEALIRSADIAMYTTKREDKGGYTYASGEECDRRVEMG